MRINNPPGMISLQLSELYNIIINKSNILIRVAHNLLV